MIAEVVASGTELIRGRSVDTNSPYIARKLNALGHDVRFISCFGDHLGELCGGLETAFRRAKIIVMTGGLGPTVDDLTRDAVARVTRRPLRLDPDELKKLRARFASHRMNMPDINRRQAYFPSGAVILPNPVGSAAGFLVDHRSAVLAALPGVPREMEPMLESTLALIRERFPSRVDWIDKTFKIAGVAESVVETELYPGIRKFKNVEYGITAKSGIISVIVRVHGPSAPRDIEALRAHLKKNMGAAFFGEDEDTIAKAAAELLLRKGRTLSIAESCTGGEIASRLTDIPGVSASLREAVVTYSNESKIERLGVSKRTLARYGAVSEQTAREMARGIRRGADLGAATTGIAGPTGGSADKPVGLVYMAVAARGSVDVQRKVFGGGRTDIKHRAAEFTLALIRKALLDEA